MHAFIICVFTAVGYYCYVDVRAECMREHTLSAICCLRHAV